MLQYYERFVGREATNERQSLKIFWSEIKLYILIRVKLQFHRCIN